jgi:hypothetical protein
VNRTKSARRLASALTEALGVLGELIFMGGMFGGIPLRGAEGESKLLADGQTLAEFHPWRYYAIA